MTLSIRNLAVFLPILCVSLLVLTPYLSVGFSSVNLAAIWVLMLWMLFTDISARKIILGLSVISTFMLGQALANYFTSSPLDSALLQISVVTFLFAFYPIPKKESAYTVLSTLLFLGLAWASGK